MRKLMRHTRTGKIAVYDADLIESGRWEPVDEPVATPADPKPKKPRRKGGPDDHLRIAETVSIVLFKSDGTTHTTTI